MARMFGFCIILFSAMVMIACGGGGGGSSPGNPPQTATATINPGNAPAIAAAVLDASDESQFFGDLGGLAAPAGASTGTVTVGGAPVEEVTIGPEMENCAVAGTSMFSAEIADPQTLSNGDSLSFTFMQCDEGDGVVLDGGFDFLVNLFNGDVFNDTFTLDVGVTLFDLMVTEGGETNTLDGDMNLLLDTSDTLETTITINGDSLSLVSGLETATLSDYAMTISVDPVSGSSSFSISGFLSASDFTGTVEFSSNASLAVDSLGTPSSGVIVITGADGATITVRIFSAQQIQLDVDSNGDGEVDDVIMTSWSELQT